MTFSTLDHLFSNSKSKNFMNVRLRSSDFPIFHYLRYLSSSRPIPPYPQSLSNILIRLTNVTLTLQTRF